MNTDDRIIDDELQGLGYLGQASGTISVASFTFFSGATQTFSTTLPLASEQTMSISNVKFSGVGNTGVNNKWIYSTGKLSFRNTSPSYDVLLLIDRTPDGQVIKVQLYNPTVASNQTVPNITISIKSYYYAPSW